MGHGVVHLKDLGYTPAQAAFSLSVMLFSALLGNLLVAALGDHIDPRLIWAAASFVFGVGMLVALRASGPLGLWVYAILLGLGFGACFPCVMTLPANYFGHKAYASIVGILMVTGTVIGATGSFSAGFVYDHFGSYARVFYAVALLCFFSSLVLLFLRPPVLKGERSLVAAAATGPVYE